MPGPADTVFISKLMITIILVSLTLFFWQVRDAVLLTFAAVLLALAVHGIAEALQARTRLPDRVALGLAAFLFVGVFVGVLWLFGAQLASEVSSVIDRLPQAWARA